MSEKRCFYEVLGIARESSAEEIRRAYKHEALKHHPDRNPGDPGIYQRLATFEVTVSYVESHATVDIARGSVIEARDFTGKAPTRERQLQHLVLTSGILAESAQIEVLQQALGILEAPVS